MLFDTFHRQHDYLRISITDNCNLRCLYCMPDDHYNFTAPEKLMQANEIAEIAKIFVNNGVKKIRITGGEPLIRKDVDKILLKLADLPVKLTMTTNGIRLNDYIEVMKQTNLLSLNVSLDTLNTDKYKLIAKRDYFDRVMQNINLFVDNDFHIKVNMVVMKNVNDDEILDFIELTKDRPIHVRFIEFMPFDRNDWQHDKVFTLDQILDVINQKYEFTSLSREPHDTVKKFQIKNHNGTFAVISTMTSPFCSDCNRMRLTADGKMKNCLFSKTETDLLSAFRKGLDIEALIYKNILSKEKELGGQFQTGITDDSSIVNRSMISIGG
jgi:cyclic pyranopterin phosphate synthase